MKKQLFFWFVISTVSVVVLENMVASVREEVWRPASEPETREAAEKLEKQAQQKEKIAQEALEKAKEANDTQEIQEQEAKINEAKFDRETAQKRIDYDTLLNAPQRNEEAIKSAQKALEARKNEIEAKIQAIEKTLAGTGTSIGGKTTTELYQDAFQAKFKQLAQNQNELISFMRSELIQLGQGKSKIEFSYKAPLDYTARKEILLVIDKALSSYRGTDERLNKIKSDVQDSIAEITIFEQNPPTAIANNAIDSKFKFSEKIPSDQLKILKRELAESLFKKNYITPEQQAKVLEEFRQVIDNYGIVDKGVTSLINERLLAPNVIEFRIKDAKSKEEKDAIITDVLKTVRAQSMSSPEGYAREADLLENLSKAVANLGVDERLDEIRQFKPNQKPKKETELGKRLKLENKIPMDAIALLDREAAQAMDEYKKLSETDKATASKNLIQALEDIRATMEGYSLNEGKYKEFYDNLNQRIDRLQIEAPPELPTGVSQDEAASAGFFDGTFEQARQVLIQGIDAVQGVVDYGIKKEIEVLDAGVVALQQAGDTLEHYGKMIEKVPNSVDNSIGLIQDIQDNPVVQQFQEGGVVRQVALVADPKIVSAVDKELKSAESTKKLLQSPLVQNIASRLGKLGAGLREAGKIVVGLSEGLEEQTEALKDDVATLPTEIGKEVAEKRAAQQSLELALQRVRQERLAPPLVDPQALPKTTRQKVTSFFTDLGKSIKSIFSKPKGINERLEIASKNYEQARLDYLDFLGVPKDASESTINEAIRKNQNPTQRNKLEQRLLASAKEYAGTVKEYADVLQGAKASVQMLMEMPDSLLVPSDFNDDLLQKGKIADNVNAIFDVRQQRLNYLKAIQEESAAFLSDLQNMSKGTSMGGITDRTTRDIARLIDGVYLRDLGKIAKQNAQLEDELVRQREMLQEKLPRMPTETSSTDDTKTSGTTSPIEEGPYD